MKAVQTGQRIVIALMVISISLSVLSTVTSYNLYNQMDLSSKASQALYQGIARLIITLFVYHFLYRGHKWALWVVVILLSLAVFGGVAIIFLVPMNAGFLVVYLIPLLFFIAMLYFLLFNSSVKAFLNQSNDKAQATDAK